MYSSQNRKIGDILCLNLSKELLYAVKADKKGNQWKNYHDYINCIVIDRIKEAIKTALQHLND